MDKTKEEGERLAKEMMEAYQRFVLYTQQYYYKQDPDRAILIARELSVMKNKVGIFFQS